MTAFDVSEKLTGALAQFSIEAKNSASVIDKVNEVDNNFAVTSIGLMQSITKAGEAAQEFGGMKVLAELKVSHIGKSLGKDNS